MKAMMLVIVKVYVMIKGKTNMNIKGKTNMNIDEAIKALRDKKEVICEQRRFKLSAGGGEEFIYMFYPVFGWLFYCMMEGFKYFESDQEFILGGEND